MRYMKLTRKKAISLTRELWGELAESGSKFKHTTKVASFNEFDNNCPLCHYVDQLKNDSCKYCPLVWPGVENITYGNPCMRSLYSHWCRASTLVNRKSIAKQISELPERKR